MCRADAFPALVKGFMPFLGIELISWEVDRIELTLDVTERLVNRSGILHGGVFASLIDLAGCGAGVWREDGEPIPVTVLSQTVRFIDQIREGPLTVIGRRSGGGKRIYSAEVEIRASDGRLLAVGNGTFRTD